VLTDVDLLAEKECSSVQFTVAKFNNLGLVRSVLVIGLQLDEGLLLFASSNLLRWRIEVDSASYRIGRYQRRTHRRSYG